MVAPLAAFLAEPYFFERTFELAKQAADGYIQQGVIPVAYGILAVTLLLGVYESFFRGGSLRDLGITLLRYVGAALIIQYWSTFFTDITTNGCTMIAHSLDQNQISDVWMNWAKQMSDYWQSNGGSIWGFLSADAVGGVVVLLVTIVGYVCYVVAMLLFTLIYAFWGICLYGLGPLLIALMPSQSVGQYAKNYLNKFVEWACWPILYSLFSCIMVAINSQDTASLLGSTNFADTVQNTTAVIYIGIMSILFALSLIIIPWIASSLVKSDFLGVSRAFMTAAMLAARVVGAVATGGSSEAAGAAADAGGVGGGGSGTTSSIAGGGGQGDLPPGSTSTPPSATPPAEAGRVSGTSGGVMPAAWA